MARLHPEFEQSIELLPLEHPVHLLIRHSVREQPDNPLPGMDCPLTSEGVRLATEFGEVIPRSLHRFYSSRSGRCVDTGSAIAKGAGIDREVEVHPSLAEPGCFVSDIHKAGPLFMELGPVAFANEHLSVGVEGLLSPEEGVAKIVALMQQAETPQGHLSVFVTHDTILSGFIYSLLGYENITQEHWPWMLEGVFIWFDDDHLCWLWRGELGRKSLLV